MSENQNAEEVTIDTIKLKLVGLRKQILEIHSTSSSSLSEIQGIADSFKASGKPVQMKFGDQILSHVESAAIVLDLSAVADEIRAVYGDIKVLIAAIEESAGPSEDLEAELEVLRGIAADNTKVQIALLRPRSPIFPANEQAVTDVFVCHNEPTAVGSRIEFIVDRDGDAIGVAVKSSNNIDESIINRFYFSDYYELCDKVCGRELVVDETSNDGVFVYRAVVQLAVDLADSIVSQFGGLDNALSSTRDNGGDQLRSKHESLAPITSSVVEGEESSEDDGDFDEASGDQPDAQDASGDQPEGDAGDDFVVDESLDSDGDASPDLASESSDAVDELSESFDDVPPGVAVVTEG